MTDWFSSLPLQTQNDLWVITVAVMTNVACALVGCYLVLRRMSLLGDAISHAVLPGLVVAFVLSGTLNIAYMFLGALVVGLLTAVLTQTLHEQGNVPEDASMGVVFTSLFALGVILVRRYAHMVDMDPDCVLNGLLEFVAFNLVQIGPWEMPRAMLTIGPVLLVNLLVIVVFWKELLLSSFDPGLATTMGFRAGLLHYLLMALVALTAVASFEQVGSILVIAMLIVPGATAHLLCNRLSTMLLVATAVAAGTAVAGHFLAVAWNTNTAGTMAMLAGLVYLVVVLFAPRSGALSTLLRNLQASVRIFREDLLAMLYRLEELAVGRQLSPREAAQALGGGLTPWLALRSLRFRGLAARTDNVLLLTDAGRREAVGLVRSHRLWEKYLVEKLGLPLDHVHEPAERMEHYLDERLRQEIASQVTSPDHDPHGRAIPNVPNDD
jgi:ABC-type Mn2+/Zn2+ transport system permease subunit/Mn-dependent DtxR family transcriptional regulator